MANQLYYGHLGGLMPHSIFDGKIFCTKLVSNTCFIAHALIKCMPLSKGLVVPGVYNVAK